VISSVKSRFGKNLPTVREMRKMSVLGWEANKKANKKLFEAHAINMPS